MNIESDVVQKAEFNPKIKTYLLLVGAFVMTLTVVGIPILIFGSLDLGNIIANAIMRILNVN